MALDLAVLAATVVSRFLFPYVKKGAERLAEEISERVSDVAAEHATSLASRAWDRVRSVFSSPKEQTKLELFEEEPDEYAAGIERTLREKLEQDPELARELQELIDAPSPDGSGTGAQIMQATVAGIVDLRHGTVSGGQVSGVHIENFTAPTPAQQEVSPRDDAGPGPGDRPRGDRLVGRDAEFAQLREPIDAQRPAFVLVTGRHGIGKSALIRRLLDHAVELGWSNLGEAVAVLATTTPEALTEQLRTLLGVTGSVPDGEPDGPMTEAVPEPAEASAPERRSWSQVATVVRGAVEGWPDRLPGRLGRSGREVVDALAARAPAVLTLELHRPSEQMTRWLAGVFVPALRRTETPVLGVATVEAVTNAPGLEAAADRIIELQELDAEAVRAALLDAAGPLPEHELAAYVDAASADPALLRSLLNVLTQLRLETSPASLERSHA
jgi:hypothetical protein